jgi:phosphinothricin acetyltransferase
MADDAPDIVIRLATADDAAACSAIYVPFVTSTAVSFEADPPDVAEMARRITATLERLPWFVATLDGATVGYAYASPHRSRAGYRWAVDVSAYVHADLRGRGIGRRLYAALLAVLERQRFRRAYAGIALPNAASEALHRAAGFVPVAVYRRVGWKVGAWHDVAWFERALGPDDDGVPAEPIPLPDLE